MQPAIGPSPAACPERRQIRWLRRVLRRPHVAHRGRRLRDHVLGPWPARSAPRRRPSARRSRRPGSPRAGSAPSRRSRAGRRTRCGSRTGRARSRRRGRRRRRRRSGSSSSTPDATATGRRPAPAASRAGSWLQRVLRVIGPRLQGLPVEGAAPRPCRPRRCRPSGSMPRTRSDSASPMQSQNPRERRASPTTPSPCHRRSTS